MNLFIFDHINSDPVVASLLRWQETGEPEAYYAAARGLIAFAPHRLTGQNLLKEYLLRAMLERRSLPDVTQFRDFLRQDVKALYTHLLAPDWDALFRQASLPPLSGIETASAVSGLRSYALSLESMMGCLSNEALGGAILAHVESFGTGPTSAYAALRWNDGKLEGISRPDPIRFEDLTGLEHQKKVLISNTEGFMQGRPANDVLLTGNTGTGKSSCVKACLNLYKDRGLRLVELKKSQLESLPQVLAALQNQVLKYIVFIDDLSFEPDDMSYKLLKSALDGQAELRSENILIYATSNRRSLIKETWSEREGSAGDEVHRNEGIHERKSLSARFGINLSFLSPNQTEYLEIVENLLKANGLGLTQELRAKALTWQINYNGFSGRSAKQFVASILSGQ